MCYVIAVHAAWLFSFVRPPALLRASPQVCFNPQGTKCITASSDKTCKVWDASTGECLQTLPGHTDEIFSCAFNYEGDTIITGSKDNTCRIWKS